MNPENLWYRAKNIPVRTSSGIAGEFSIGFDDAVPKETRAELTRFVCWVEENFSLPVTLWVDFEYRHYLVDRRGKRVGYLFYWSGFENYPVFDDPEAIPVIRLPVRRERWTMEEILTSFIEAITRYFAWLLNLEMEGFSPSEEDVEEILQAYLSCQTKP